MLGSPFDMAQPNQPGALGQSTDFWNGIAALGANMSAAANQRTPGGFLANGTGFWGPLGAATIATQQQGADLAKTRSAIGFQGAQTQGLQLQNQLAAMNLPLAQASAQLSYRMMTDPNFARQYMQQFQGMGGTPYGAGQPQQSQGQQPASAGAIPPEQRMPLIQQALKETGHTNMPPDLIEGLAGYESGWNPAAVNKTSGAFGLTGILPSTAKAPGFGMQPLPPNASPLDQLKFGIEYLYQRGKAAGIQDSDWQDPTKVLPALAAYHGPATDANGVNGQDYAANVTGRMKVAQNGLPQSMTDASVAAPPQNMDTQAQAQIARLNQQADQSLQMANQLESAQSFAKMMQARNVMWPMPPGDPAAYRTAAQQYRNAALELQNAGLVAQQKAENSNFGTRAGGMARIQTPQGPQWVKNPMLEKVQGPNGAEYYTHISPPLPGSPPGSPGESSPVLQDGKPAMAKLPDNVQGARDAAFKEFATKDNDAYLSAQNTLSWLEQMDNAADRLNAGGGFLSTGPTSASRMAFASTVNDVMRTMGMPNAFDASKIGSWEELKKATTTAGFELSSHYEGHARQAAQTIENATSAVPSAANSPVGFKVVAAGIREAAQSAIDLHNFKQQVYNANTPESPQGGGPLSGLANGLKGDLTKAEVAFYSQNPAQMYARRAISEVHPYTVKADKELTRYLPGTFVLYKGQVVQVPEREGAPPIPEYLKNMQPPTAQAAGPQQ